MFGTLVNCVAIVLGGGIGLIAKRGISEKLNKSIMSALALCVFYIGISGAMECQNILIVILSMVIGTIIGEGLDLDEKIRRIGEGLEKRVNKNGEDGTIAKGFVTASLLFCVGAMAIVGSLQSGISGNHETLFAKSLMDAVAAAVLSSTLGFGVLLSAGFVLVYQGAITLCASFLEPLLTDVIIAEMTCTGSLIIVALSFNLLKITNIKVMNYVPSVFVPIVIYWILELF
ncbi:MAG: DUF554 domain-containing protein [Clostridia bacterium]|nr:DUF554 domain-containing protein [Clostridia bacterium]